MAEIHVPNIIGPVQVAGSAGLSGQALISAGPGVQAVWGHDDHALLSSLLGLAPYHHLPAPVAPAAALMNVAGIINGQTNWQSQPLFSAINPANIGVVASPGTSLEAAHRDHVHDTDSSSFEGGTFIPTLAGSVTPGTFTYTIQQGYWTRVGDIVFYNGIVTASAISVAPTGSVNIAGLPFVSSVAANNFNSVALGFINAFTIVATTVQVTAFVNPNSSRIEVFESLGLAPTVATPMPVASFTANSSLMFSGMLKV